jgi:chromosome segregation ATPase
MNRQFLSCAVAALLATSCFVATVPGADKEAERRQREQDRQRDLRNRRAALDDQIRAAERRLKQVRQQLDQFKKNLPVMQKQYEEAARTADQYKSDVINTQREIDNVKKDFTAASDKVRQARQGLEDLANELESQLPADAALSQARKRYDTAQRKYEEELKKTLDSPELAEATQAEVNQGDRIKAAEVRSRFLKSNATLAAAEMDLKSSRTQYEGLREKLLAGSSERPAAEASLKLAQEEMAEAGKQLEAANKKLHQGRATRDDQVETVKKMSAVGRTAQAQALQLDVAQKYISDQIGQLRRRRNSLR